MYVCICPRLRRHTVRRRLISDTISKLKWKTCSWIEHTFFIFFLDPVCLVWVSKMCVFYPWASFIWLLYITLYLIQRQFHQHLPPSLEIATAVCHRLQLYDMTVFSDGALDLKIGWMFSGRRHICKALHLYVFSDDGSNGKVEWMSSHRRHICKAFLQCASADAASNQKI